MVVSEKGLVFTNHHCGYGAIQKLSAVEHDYLKDGFKADSFGEELHADGLNVSFLRSMDDVTEQILSKLEPNLTEVERLNAIDSIGEVLIERYEKKSEEVGDVLWHIRG